MADFLKFCSKIQFLGTIFQNELNFCIPNYPNFAKNYNNFNHSIKITL